MHEVIGQQAAVLATAIARATLADVEQTLVGCHRHSALARLGYGELLHQCMVVVNVIGVDLAIVHHVEPVCRSAAARVRSDADGGWGPRGLVDGSVVPSSQARARKAVGFTPWNSTCSQTTAPSAAVSPVSRSLPRLVPSLRCVRRRISAPPAPCTTPTR